MILTSRRRFLAGLSAGALAASLPGTGAWALSAVTGFRQGVAEAAARHEVLAAFYRMRGFEGIWTGSDDRAVARRNALLTAMVEAPAHGLGVRRHDPQELVRTLQDARTPYEQGQAEVAMSRAFLRLAGDLNAGLLTPSKVTAQIKREVLAADPLAVITVFPDEEPTAFLRGLAPATAEYARLLREKIRLEALIASGGWGAAAPTAAIGPGQGGASVVALRDRLIDMGWLAPTATARYDGLVADAVRRFQAAHGLNPDGVAGEGTLSEVNLSATDRLRSVLVALERERWNAAPRGARHVWVNLTDFTAMVVDDDVPTFRTRAVIGAHDEDRETPEFSDLMQFMVINPSWFVPRSIIVNEYLPQLRGNPNAAGHLKITDSAGRVINRGSVNFASYSARSFPYAMHQPPGPSNALGVVKFMFPNPWNIYLHDTPAKDLFQREVRAFSHGCIRLADPRGFAYHLLARQSPDPKGVFDSKLQSGAETRVNLDQPIPVHLEYRTAFTTSRGGLQFRRDVYGRDARIWAALEAEGVEAAPLQG
ncbi:L,D-transpeptidase family protein [Rubellimicrobium roseum]|uniref:Murein L,D-transpeptidase n=1 Tax=Rubellimicrobium roseum TaxID=687525 RepID=A0A5C4N7Z9_9RHOB|nr:L,D-transpeptidase family protein [Rubellimicrobium roseum]TNC69516.1 murein L,D-transpeptidase [Rubellimicrobium roseum]